MKVKVCGITSLEQLRQLQQMGVDYAGLIFYEGSKRYAADKLAGQRSEIKNLEIKKAGVFVNAGYQTISKAIDDYGLTAVQLHGDETDEFCLELMDKVQVIKVFRMAGEKNIDELVEAFQNVCHYFLFDTGPSNSPNAGEPQAQTKPPHPPTGGLADARSSPAGETVNNTISSQSGASSQFIPPPGVGALFGGTGQQFDWSVLQNATINKPFFLSGGIGLDDVEKVNAFHHSYLYAIDVNSRFETEPGVKNLKKVQEFINALNHE